MLVVYGAWPDFWSRKAGLLQGGLINYAPSSSFAHGDNPAYAEYHWHGLWLLTGNAYILAGMAIFLALAAAAISTSRHRMHDATRAGPAGRDERVQEMGIQSRDGAGAKPA